VNTSSKTFSGFSSGQRADASLDRGTWLAYLLPNPEIKDMQYGPAFQLRYNVFVPSTNGTKRFEITELASENFSTGSKFMRRIAAVNRVQITEETDLSTLKAEGFCLVTLDREDNSAFLNISNVAELPRNYPIPSDVKSDPVSRSMERWSTEASEKDTLNRVSTAASHAVNPDDEPPF
jgi:hypothetical protein